MGIGTKPIPISVLPAVTSSAPNAASVFRSRRIEIRACTHKRGQWPNVRSWGWSQRVDATLYPEKERWSVRQCVEVIFEALRHQRKQSFGIAGSAASR